MADYFILGVRNGDHFEIKTKSGSPISYNREDFKREYDLLAYRVGTGDIAVFREVHVSSRAICSLPDELELVKYKD